MLEAAWSQLEKVIILVPTQTGPVSCGPGLWAISENFDLFCLSKYKAQILLSKAIVPGSGERKESGPKTPPPSVSDSR